MIMDIDNTQAATAWLALRLVHLACYSFGFAMLRSLSWVGSVVALVYMAMQLA
jgi:uncharacterized MAPEG superfamily protein